MDFRFRLLSLRRGLLYLENPLVCGRSVLIVRNFMHESEGLHITSPRVEGTRSGSYRRVGVMS